MERITLELTRDQAQALLHALDDAWEYLDWIADETDREDADDSDVIAWRTQRDRYGELHRLIAACIEPANADSTAATLTTRT